MKLCIFRKLRSMMFEYVSKGWNRFEQVSYVTVGSKNVFSRGATLCRNFKQPLQLIQTFSNILKHFETFERNRCNKCITLLVLVFLLVSISPKFCFADLRKEAGQFLVDMAKDFSENGNNVEAVHEFSKALLADPNNQEARKYLAEYGLPQGLYKPMRTYTTTKIAVAQELNYYEQRMGELRDVKQHMNSIPGKVTRHNSSLKKENKIEPAQVAALDQKLNDHNFGHVNSNMDLGENKVGDLSGSNLEHASLKVVVEDLEQRLMDASRDSIHQDIALVKMQNDMIKHLDDSISAHGQLDQTQQKYISHLDQNINQPQMQKATNQNHQKLQAELLEAQDRVSEQNMIVDYQNKQIQSIENDLKDANNQVERIINNTK